MVFADSVVTGRSQTRRRRQAMTMVELLVALGITIILMGLLLPAVMQAREATRRAACQSNLRQIGVALTAFEQLHGVFPPGRDATDGNDHSWATVILVQLEQTQLVGRYDKNHAWNDGSPGVPNLQISNSTLPVFLCPSTSHSASGLTDYGGNYGSSLTGIPKGFGVGLAWDSGVLLAMNTPSRTSPEVNLLPASRISDGLTNTLLVVEDAGRQPDQGGRWADGKNCLAHEYPSINFNRKQGIYSDHPGGAAVCMADASVRFLPQSTPTEILGALCTRDHHDNVAPDAGDN